MNKRTRAKLVGILFIIVLVIIVAYLLYGNNTNLPVTETYEYSFETSMEGWTVRGIDLLNPPINWSVNRTQTESYSGEYSVQLYLENFNDAGKIWIEKEYNVKPNSNYQVSISYYFGTADYGDINLFTLITGASAKSPEQVTDLIFQGSTGHGQDTTNLVWLEKQFTFHVETNLEGTLFAYIGVWGTWETIRLYFFDDVVIEITDLM